VEEVLIVPREHACGVQVTRETGDLHFCQADLHQLTTSSLSASSLPTNSRKRRAGCSDSIRSIGFEGDHRFNVRWLEEACRILRLGGTIWVTGTHHIIFSLGFALQTIGFKVINNIEIESKRIRCVATRVEASLS